MKNAGYALRRFSSAVRGYAGSVVGAVPADGHYLLITIGNRSDEAPRGFHALPIDDDGAPLASEPTGLKVIEGELHGRFELLVAQDRPLLAWLQGATINAIQLSSDGQIVQELTLAPEFAGRVQHFAARR